MEVVKGLTDAEFYLRHEYGADLKELEISPQEYFEHFVPEDDHVLTFNDGTSVKFDESGVPHLWDRRREEFIPTPAYVLEVN